MKSKASGFECQGWSVLTFVCHISLLPISLKMYYHVHMEIIAVCRVVQSIQITWMCG